MTGPRHVVGIDLGTTNCAITAVDLAAGENAPIEVLPVLQVVAPGQVDQRSTLPSFLYLPGTSDLPSGALALPWDPARGHAVGELARSRGVEVPSRLVASAKSWLCHPGVDRNARILPWGAPDEVSKLSPVDACTRYLEHLCDAWGALHPEAPLAEQDVLITVPASFDAIARELTVEAARRAGLPQVTLLEEPQAAFYSWLAHAGDRWRKQLTVGDVVLACDIGGGTTDFTLISVTDQGGDLTLERVAVGDHILLGGDNMDLALSYGLAQKLSAKGTKLDAWQQRALTHSCRHAKEQLLADASLDKVPVTVLGRSSRLIGGTIRVDLTRNDVEGALLDGFFPACGAGDKPQRSRRVGFQELGLPYATDPGVTRHLAEFLSRHGRLPTAVLFNGGVMKGAVLRQRLGDVIQGWAGTKLKQLEGTDFDLAVAHGAAYYGLTRRGRGIRIRGGAARSYYIGVETAMPAVPGMRPPLKALCVVPFGTEEGTEAELPNQEFGLMVGEPAEFRFFGSSVRRTDALGTVVEELEGDIEELAPVEAVLSAGEGIQAGMSIPVRLRAHVTPVGTLELFCVTRDGSRRWKLEFNVRERE
ncbi:MAG: Hsp70 family protein [Deltaproteobacteria bacterium]|nr:Hsp70 family protein [Deltaproteobacteria bacterium]